MRGFLVVLGTILCLGLSSQAQTKLNITTFNMKWFGIGGDPNHVQAEYRIPTMKTFIQKYLSFTDVFVFEEVVDLKTLTQIIPASWQCVGYTHPDPIHQYVAMCAQPALQFTQVAYDKDFTIEEVTTGSPRMRPAVRADLRDRRTNQILLTLVGVHLKATPTESARRITQAKFIAKDVLKVPANIPVVITGDFNVFKKEETKLNMDDVDLLNHAFNSASKGYSRVPLKAGIFTFRNNQFRNQFDQFYLRGPITVATEPYVFPVCSATKDGPEFMNFAYYYQNVSDHCPASIQVVLGSAKMSRGLYNMPNRH